MSEAGTQAEAAAQARTEEAQEFVRRVRRVTRRRFSPEEKVRIVLEGFRREVTVNDLCRREGIKPNVYYAWLKDFMEAGKTRLRADQRAGRQPGRGGGAPAGERPAQAAGGGALTR